MHDFAKYKIGRNKLHSLEKLTHAYDHIIYRILTKSSVEPMEKYHQKMKLFH